MSRIGNDIDKLLNIQGQVRDYDFTKKALRMLKSVVSSEDFGENDSEVIFQYLFSTVETVSFCDFLKRYVYERSGIKEPYSSVSDADYQAIITEAFRDNRCPSSLRESKKKVSAVAKGWLHMDYVHRDSVFLCGFALQMTEKDVSEFLTKVIREQDFAYSEPREIIFWYCYKNRLPFAKAARLLQMYEELDANAGDISPEAVNAGSRLMPGRNEKVPEIHTEEDLKEYLKQLKRSRSVYLTKEKAFYIFCGYVQKAKLVIAGLYNSEAPERRTKKEVYSEKDITSSDIEHVLCNGIPVKGKGDLEKLAASKLNRAFQSYRFTRQRLDNLLAKKCPVDRYDLMTLVFFICSQEMADLAPAQRYENFLRDMNKIYRECGMMSVYPVNPYEAFILLCLLSESPFATFSEVWEMSYEG